jgi:hypothetical protein
MAKLWGYPQEVSSPYPLPESEAWRNRSVRATP